MAWPSTPLTTYIASSTPSIKAADLNAIQNAINKIILGTYTIKNLVLDGVGGASTSLPGPAATNPASTVAQRNTLSPSNIPKSWGFISTGASPVVNAGFNIATITYNGSKARITLAQAITDTNYCVVATMTTTANLIVPTIVSASIFDLSAILIDGSLTVLNLSSSGRDIAFTVFGRQ